MRFWLGGSEKSVNGWQRWVKAPQTLWWRRVLFQIHLWAGIGLGLYVLVISVSGSAVVLRPQVTQWFTPSQVTTTEGEPLAGAALEARVDEVYKGHEVVDLVPSTLPRRALYVVLEKTGSSTAAFSINTPAATWAVPIRGKCAPWNGWCCCTMNCSWGGRGGW